MPVRGVARADWDALNSMLVEAYQSSPGLFTRLHQEKPLVPDSGQIYVYDPRVDPPLAGAEPGQILAYCGIYPHRVQFGAATLVLGGVGNVASHPVVRGKGAGLTVMKAACRHMNADEYDLSLLFSGANHFYEKCGWRGGITLPAWLLPPETTARVSGDVAFPAGEGASRGGVEVAPFTPGDLPAVASLHSRALAGAYYAAHRSLEYWQNHFTARPERYWNFFTLRAAGDLAGYFSATLAPGKQATTILASVHEFHVDPACYAGYPVAGAGDTNLEADHDAEVVAVALLGHALRYLEREALRPGDALGPVRLHLSRASPLVRGLAREGLTLVDQSTIALNVMLRVTNPHSLFRRLAPEFTRRVRAAPSQPAAAWVAFTRDGTYPGGALLRVGEGVHGTDGTDEMEATDGTSEVAVEVEVTRDPGTLARWQARYPDGAQFQTISDLALVTCGIVPPASWPDLIEDDQLRVTGAGLEWLEVLFAGVSFDMSPMDHF